MRKKTIGYGVIGCGMHALRGHVEPAAGIKVLKFVSAYDPKPDQAAKLCALGHKARSYTEPLAIFKDSKVHAIVICSPDQHHIVQLGGAIIHKKHVLVEKPAATTIEGLSDLEGFLRSAREKEIVVSSCHPRRYDDLYMKIQELIPHWTGLYGKVQSIGLDFSYHAPTRTGLHTGLLADHLNHEYDLMNFLLGRRAVEAHRLYDREDRYHAVGTREDDITFSFTGTRKLKAKEYREWLTIRFAKAQLTVDANTGMARLRDDETGAEHWPNLPHSPYEVKFRRVMENFAGAINGEEDCYLTHDDIVANTAICVHLTERGVWAG